MQRNVDVYSNADMLRDGGASDLLASIKYCLLNEINFREINSHTIYFREINFSRDQFSRNQLEVYMKQRAQLTNNTILYSPVWCLNNLLVINTNGLNL